MGTMKKTHSMLQEIERKFQQDPLVAVNSSIALESQIYKETNLHLNNEENSLNA